jgi:hypothetical protein
MNLSIGLSEVRSEQERTGLDTFVLACHMQTHSCLELRMHGGDNEKWRNRKMERFSLKNTIIWIKRIKEITN